MHTYTPQPRKKRFERTRGWWKRNACGLVPILAFVAVLGVMTLFVVHEVEGQIDDRIRRQEERLEECRTTNAPIVRLCVGDNSFEEVAAIYHERGYGITHTLDDYVIFEKPQP